MKFRKIRVTQVASIAFVLFAALLYFVINPRWVPDNRLFGVSPRTVPNLCAFAFAALGIALFLETLGKKAKADPSIIELSPRGIRMMVISFASVIAWAVCVKTTHYIPTVAVLYVGSWPAELEDYYSGNDPVSSYFLGTIYLRVQDAAAVDTS